MKQNAYIAGVGMTPFGKFPHRGLKDLTGEAIRVALADAGLAASALQAAYMGTAGAAVMTGQVMISGQVMLRQLGIGRIPVVNVENACATSATAFDQAATMITLGLYDVVIAVGFEKLYDDDKLKSFSVFRGAVDTEAIDDVVAELDRNMTAYGSVSAIKDAGTKRSLFMDIYAKKARDYMAQTGATPRHFAAVSVKTAEFGSLNPRAQYRDRLTLEQVLAAPTVSDPLTLLMCCPLGDGAAAVILVSERYRRQMGGDRFVRVRATELASGYDLADDTMEDVVRYASRRAYEEAEVGPEDVDVVELHDAASPAELICYEQLGLCGPGESVRLIETGVTGPGGRLYVNPSGGMLRKGHPVGASGCAQIVELTEQLRGESGPRQKENARIALAENGGGWIGEGPAALVISILGRD